MIGITQSNISATILTDREYLTQLIFHISLFRNNEICSIKDTNSTYLAATPIYATMLGFLHPLEIIGKKDEDLPHKLAKFAYNLNSRVNYTYVTINQY